MSYRGKVTSFLQPSSRQIAKVKDGLDKNKHPKIPLQIELAIWRASNLRKSVPKNGHYYLQRAVTPYQITLQNCLHKARGDLKAVKALWTPHFFGWTISLILK
jgi:hypothetical protein